MAVAATTGTGDDRAIRRSRWRSGVSVSLVRWHRRVCMMALRSTSSGRTGGGIDVRKDRVETDGAQGRFLPHRRQAARVLQQQGAQVQRLGGCAHADGAGWEVMVVTLMQTGSAAVCRSSSDC